MCGTVYDNTIGKGLVHGNCVTLPDGRSRCDVVKKDIIQCP